MKSSPRPLSRFQSNVFGRLHCAVLLVAAAAWAVTPAVVQGDESPGGRWAIVLHGGAGSAPSADEAANEQRRAGVRSALQAGVDVLRAGGTSLDAVEAVIRVMEDDAQFNAGKGAVYNAAGRHELDASIMDGAAGNGGAVAGVTIVKNPISLARRVMTDTRHVLLAGPGADQFARECEMALVTNDYFDTESSRKEWEQRRATQRKSDHMGTVGCVALDRHGNLAAGTSTGGLTDKKYGRVGDSPILGAGTFADNATCAISATGIGELFIRGALAFDVSAQMKYKQRSLSEAMQDVIHQKLEPNTGGMIGVNAEGVMHAEFNTRGMATGMANSSGRFDVLW